MMPHLDRVESGPAPVDGHGLLGGEAEPNPQLLHDHLVEDNGVDEHEDARAAVEDHEQVGKLL